MIIVKTPKNNNFYYVSVSIIYTYKRTKLDAEYKVKDLKILKGYKTYEKTKAALFDELVKTSTLVKQDYKKLTPNRYYIEYTIFKLDDNEKRKYEGIFFSKINALHLKSYM